MCSPSLDFINIFSLLVHPPVPQVQGANFGVSYYVVAVAAQAQGPFVVVSKNVTTLAHQDVGDFNLFADKDGAACTNKNNSARARVAECPRCVFVRLPCSPASHAS